MHSRSLLTCTLIPKGHLRLYDVILVHLIPGAPPRPDAPPPYVHTGAYPAGSFVRRNFSPVPTPPPENLSDLDYFVLKFGKNKIITIKIDYRGVSILTRADPAGGFVARVCFELTRNQISRRL